MLAGLRMVALGKKKNTTHNTGIMSIIRLGASLLKMLAERPFSGPHPIDDSCKSC